MMEQQRRLRVIEQRQIKMMESLPNLTRKIELPCPRTRFDDLPNNPNYGTRSMMERQRRLRVREQKQIEMMESLLNRTRKTELPCPRTRLMIYHKTLITELALQVVEPKAEMERNNGLRRVF
ncbi:hypothetical protein Scep_030244 [Stephania cephalantha]|uniref:Uncharacterized protein n=1 Tax=Stephania cephalantha TaxID=152367 RepID=A0AAP0HD00_9MAGN